ncbi:phosphomethylpyrimidine kinase domain-containing protein [Ditylenchus destructor]|nr:phosphomethylpyrimidine kinase domain-containing protein [Ditylenchus destructor]
MPGRRGGDGAAFARRERGIPAGCRADPRAAERATTGPAAPRDQDRLARERGRDGRAARAGRDALLVVDPVLGATAGSVSGGSTGRVAFCDDALLDAYRHQLLPRAALMTPNRREAERLLGVASGQHPVPELAAMLRGLGAQAVCITGGDDGSQIDGLAMDWLDSRWATGWIAMPRLAPREGEPLHHHGSGCTFATAAAAALARGFAVPDAVILAKMLTWSALRDGHAAGAGSGPLRPDRRFVDDPRALPVMGFDDETSPDRATLTRWREVLSPSARRAAPFAKGLYAITDRPERIAALARRAGLASGPGGLGLARCDGAGGAATAPVATWREAGLVEPQPVGAVPGARRGTGLHRLRPAVGDDDQGHAVAAAGIGATAVVVVDGGGAGGRIGGVLTDRQWRAGVAAGASAMCLVRAAEEMVERGRLG